MELEIIEEVEELQQRETAARVAAGAVARKILGNKTKIRGALIQIGKKK